MVTSVVLAVAQLRQPHLHASRHFRLPHDLLAASKSTRFRPQPYAHQRLTRPSACAQHNAPTSTIFTSQTLYNEQLRNPFGSVVSKELASAQSRSQLPYNQQFHHHLASVESNALINPLKSPDTNNAPAKSIRIRTYRKVGHVPSQEHTRKSQGTSPRFPLPHHPPVRSIVRCGQSRKQQAGMRTLPSWQNHSLRGNRQRQDPSPLPLPRMQMQRLQTATAPCRTLRETRIAVSKVLYLQPTRTAHQDSTSYEILPSAHNGEPVWQAL